MKNNYLKRIISVILTAFMTVSLVACAKSNPFIGQRITIDENGMATWEAFPDATGYHVEFVHWEDCPIFDYEMDITENCVQLQKGQGIIVSPLFADGSRGDSISSDYWGSGYVGQDENEENNNDDPNIVTEGGVFYKYDIDEDDLSTWEVVSNLDVNSFKKNNDGSVYFESKGPDGNPVRFWGNDIEIEENKIIFHKVGKIMSMDSVGRIYSADIKVSDPGSEGNDICQFGGYDVYGNPHPGKLDNMAYTATTGIHASDYTGPDFDISGNMADYQPNFIGIGVASPLYRKDEYPNVDDVTVSALYISYMPEETCTGIKGIVLNEENYGYIMDGDRYDKSKEGRYDPYKKVFDFTIYGVPELVGERQPKTMEEYRNLDPGYYAIFLSDTGNYKVGELKDKNGNVLDKDKACYEEGVTLEICVGDKTIDMPFYTYDPFSGKTMHDLVSYAFPEATGDLNVLVIPIAWNDQKSYASTENLNKIKNHIGRVIDEKGNETDYSSNLSNRFSLSEYFDISSYGKLKVNSFVTDWYEAPYNFSEMKKSELSEEMEKEIIDWFYAEYPDLDMKKFDQDENGYFDSVILINAGDMTQEQSYEIVSFGGAYNYRKTYGKEFAGTKDKPLFNCYVNINISFLDERENTLVHEFSHGLGLIDYYDVYYTGANAVGGYDMQSDSFGDWNVYSKYAVDWIDPEVITGLKSGESVDITIGSFADTGEAIIIPTEKTDSYLPFGEYLAIELFTDSGVNKYDAEEFNLVDFAGVRIYHIDAVMESHDYVPEFDESMSPVTVGTIHYPNCYNENGFYNIEVIQAGGDNTFTDLDNLRNVINKSDFFMAGSEFTMEKYKDFFKDGMMDDLCDFDYSVEVVSIEGKGKDAKAVIRVKKD